jgi:hypothetical protein
LVSPFLNSGLYYFLAKINAGNKVKIFFISYVSLLLLTVVVAIFLSYFEKDFVMHSAAYGTGCIFFTFINGEKYFVSCTLSQHTVDIQYLTPLLKAKVIVLPINQITSTTISAGKGWYNLPHKYTLTSNGKAVWFYILNPITSNDCFYLIDNTEANPHQPAEA